MTDSETKVGCFKADLLKAFDDARNGEEVFVIATNIQPGKVGFRSTEILRHTKDTVTFKLNGGRYPFSELTVRWSTIQGFGVPS